MSIAILNQVYGETRRLTVAGSNLAVGDFRLKKLVEPLKKAGAKAPVFAKVAEGIERLVDGAEKDSPENLLSLSSLVLAIMYTQGQTGSKMKLQAIPSTDLGISTTQVSSRILKPLLEALTTTGSGRHETITEAFERGAFSDLRLVNPAIDALDDKYGEIGDFMADTVLPTYGKAIVPQIKDRIDIKGRAGNTRRLRLLYRLAPEMARPIVRQAFDEGSKEMKIAALGCLGDQEEDLPDLLEQSGARAKDVRRVAMERLAKFEGKEVEAVFETALKGKDLDLAVLPLQQTQNRKLIEFAQAECRGCLAELVGNKEKKQQAKLVDRLDLLIRCFFNRQEKTSLDLLHEMFERRSEWLQIAEAAPILDTLSTAMLISGDKKSLQLLSSLHADCPEKNQVAFEASVIAVFRSQAPKKAYADLHSYYQEWKKSRGRKRERADVVQYVLCGNDSVYRLSSYYSSYAYRYGYRRAFFDCRDEESKDNAGAQLKLDPGWLKLAMAQEDIEAVSRLATLSDKAAMAFLVKFAKTKAGKNADDWARYQVTRRLVELNHKSATEILVAQIQEASKAKRNYYTLAYYVFPLIAELPKSSVNAIEQSLDGMPENYIDQIMPHLLTLKQKAK